MRVGGGGKEYSGAASMKESAGAMAGGGKVNDPLSVAFGVLH